MISSPHWKNQVFDSFNLFYLQNMRSSKISQAIVIMFKLCLTGYLTCRLAHISCHSVTTADLVQPAGQTMGQTLPNCNDNPSQHQENQLFYFITIFFTEYEVIKDQPGNIYDVRAMFDRLPDPQAGPHQLSFQKDS